jgi:hypothetical protein
MSETKLNSGLVLNLRTQEVFPIDRPLLTQAWREGKIRKGDLLQCIEALWHEVQDEFFDVTFNKKTGWLDCKKVTDRWTIVEKMAQWT